MAEKKNKNRGSGFVRYVRYLFLKLDKIQASPYAIASGFACGSAISFTPFVGFHTLLAVLTALIVRGNILSAAIGTVVGNPWTFPLIWPTTLYTGRFFLGYGDGQSIDFMHLFKNLMTAVQELNPDLFVSDIWPILKPMMVGCIPYYILAWFLSYYPVKKAMDRFSERRARLRGEK